VTTMAMSHFARVKVMIRELGFVCCRAKSLRDRDFPDLFGKKVEAPRISTLSKVESKLLLSRKTPAQFQTVASQVGLRRKQAWPIRLRSETTFWNLEMATPAMRSHSSSTAAAGCACASDCSSRRAFSIPILAASFTS
jgi:hypothetical protein